MLTSLLQQVSINKNLRIITIPQHVIFIIGVVLVLLDMTSAWWLLVAYLGWFFIGFIGFNIFYHRYISHSAFQTYKILEIIGVYLGLLAGRGSPVWMANIHTPYHHRYSDTDLDPHSPTKGFWYAYFTWQNNPPKLNPMFCRKMLRIPSMKFMSDHYYKIYWITFIILFLIKWELAVFFFIGAGVLQTHSEAIIATFGHMPNHGTREHETGDNSRNLRGIFNWITLGSGLHNNHHARPGHYSYETHPGDFDFARRIIELIAKPGSLRTGTD
jgi:stearoyl-CoA desaturase (delta-9 desaturase)